MFGEIDYGLGKISENDFVVDLGGGPSPFVRANKVIDIMTYDAYLKCKKENDRIVSESNWITMDFSYAEPLPFEDKSVDFVVCSHTLEDLNNPIWLCKEINRVAKRGYIEVPSRLIESMKGLELSKPLNDLYTGYYHHKWFVELINDEVVFTHKNPLINFLPDAFFDRKEVDSYIEEADYYIENSRICYRNLAIYWKNSFKFRENIALNEINGILDEFKDFKKRCLHELKNHSFDPKIVTSGIWGTYMV